MRARTFLTPALALVASIAACSDPVRDAQVRNLGVEFPNVPVGEYHRAGQPCVVCHGGAGPASMRFTVAGTVFAQQGAAVGVDGATVAMTDSAGSVWKATTNCVGNFFVRPGEWDPAFPILVRVFKGNQVKTMQGAIGRERSCGYCHDDPSGGLEPFRSAGHIYLYASGDSVPAAANCPVNPQVGGSK
jgi:hypothetical protein